MATQTPNLGLTLPVGGENVSRQIINQNMTLIDQYCGAINQSTYRLVPFTLAVNDWVSSGGQWVVNFLTAYVTASSDEIITFGSSLTNAQAHIIAEKKSGGGGVVFTTATKPTGAIQGMIRIFDNDDHKIPILVEGTVTPIANGGTGQSTLSGAQQALGITALSNQMVKFTKVLWEGTAFVSGSLTVPNLDDYRVVELFFSDTSSMLAIRAGSRTILWGGLTYGAYRSNGISTIACRYSLPGGSVIKIDENNRGYTDGNNSNYSGNTTGLIRVVGISPYPAA